MKDKSCCYQLVRPYVECLFSNTRTANEVYAPAEKTSYGLRTHANDRPVHSAGRLAEPPERRKRAPLDARNSVLGSLASTAFHTGHGGQVEERRYRHGGSGYGTTYTSPAGGEWTCRLRGKSWKTERAASGRTTTVSLHSLAGRDIWVRGSFDWPEGRIRNLFSIFARRNIN